MSNKDSRGNSEMLDLLRIIQQSPHFKELSIELKRKHRNGQNYKDWYKMLVEIKQGFIDGFNSEKNNQEGG